VEGFSTENKPHLMVIGHFHTNLVMFLRNMWVMHPGGFQGQTPFLARKAVFPVIGGYLVEIEQDNKGIVRFKFEYRPLHKPRVNDF
jgi:hypothetical protein